MILLTYYVHIKIPLSCTGDVFSDRPPPSIVIRGDRKKGLVSDQYGKTFKEKKMLVLQSLKDFGFNGWSLEETAMKETSSLVERFKKVADGTSLGPAVVMEFLQ